MKEHIDTQMSHISAQLYDLIRSANTAYDQGNRKEWKALRKDICQLQKQYHQLENRQHQWHLTHA